MKNLLLTFAILFTSFLHAQTVSPVLVDCGKKCSGAFTVTNNGLTPLAVTVEPYSFSIAPDGRPNLRPLDATVTVTLDEMSARLGPRAEHEFGYKILCAKTPCLVQLFAAMVVGHTDDGMAVRVMLPHVIYSCDKQKNCRSSVRKEAGLAQ